MRVQRVLMPDSEFETWTLLGDDQMPVEPVERFLAYLASTEKSPNTPTRNARDPIRRRPVSVTGSAADVRPREYDGPPG